MRKRIGGTVRVNKPVVEQATFDNKGTWEAYYAAQAWAEAKGFTAGSTCSMLPLALVKAITMQRRSHGSGRTSARVTSNTWTAQSLATSAKAL